MQSFSMPPKQREVEVMSNTNLDKVIAEIQSLPYDELVKLRRVLDDKLRDSAPPLPMTPRFVRRTNPPKDRSREFEWLSKHRDEYAGQWVALDGDRLIAHDSEYEPVSASAREADIEDALILLVEGSNALPFAGL